MPSDVAGHPDIFLPPEAELALWGKGLILRSSGSGFQPQPSCAFASEIRSGSFKLIAPKFSACYLAKRGS